MRRLGSTQDKLDSLDRKFQSGGDVGKQRFTGKVDPSLVLGLAEERMKKLLDTYDADKTVSFRSEWLPRSLYLDLHSACPLKSGRPH